MTSRSLAAAVPPFLAPALAVVLAVAAAVVPTSPAGAATTLVCPPGVGELVPAPDELQRPNTTSSVSLTGAGGAAENAYAGMMIPQAVVRDATIGRTFVAFFAPAAPVGGRTAVHTVVAAVDDTGAVVERTVLAKADGTPVLFDQGAATTTSSNGNVDDSHNGLTLAIDPAGFVHVAGNAHNDDLPYWRSATAHSVAVMDWKSTLPGVKTFPNGISILAASKDRVATSPRLFLGPGGRLFLSYRHWVSGDGSLFLYAYDTATRVWTSVSGAVPMPNADPAYAYTEGLPLLDGRAQGLDGSLSLSPETDGPVLGPDGRWWLLWSWRDLASSADTNSRVSLARSTDLRTWTTVSGKTLPRTIDYSLVDEAAGYGTLVVDDVPRAGGGLLNNQLALGWDTANRPVVSYFRYAGTGAKRSTQLFAARPNGLSAQWIVNQVSRWTGVYDLAAGASPTVLQTAGSSATPTGEAGRLALAYQCNGVSRVLTIGPGSFTGSSVFVRDAADWTSDLPIEAQRLPAGSPSTLAARSAVSPTWRDGAGRLSRSILVWGSGPWIVDGRAPVTGTYPVAGYPLRLVTVVADG